jgi:CheY-like chemotaxis protein
MGRRVGGPAPHRAGARLLIEVTIGPAPSRSAAAWLDSAEETFRTLKCGDFDIPWDVLVEFEHYLTAWRAHLDLDEETFLWSAEIDSDLVRRVGLHWARMVSVVRSGRPSGLAAAPPEAAAFYDAVAVGIAEGLAAASDPVADAFAAAVPAFDAIESPSADALPPTRVLIVDDDEERRLILRVWLEGDAAFEVAGEASDGHRAIEAARYGQPDVALLDLHLTGVDGMDVLPLIHAVAPQCAVIVVSAGDDHVRAASAGAAAFLPKSAPIDAVLDAVRCAAGRR